jgi:hypothetical protein
MPKKKLTKAQVKRKFTTATNSVYDLVLDKFGHSDSRISMSKPKLMEILDNLQRAKERTK